MAIKNVFGGGNGETTTIIVSSPPEDTTLLAKFDFSQMPDQSLKTDGDYTIPVSSGSTSATTATLKVVKCAAGPGIGAAGIQRINAGALELMPDVVTSEFGLQYWSTKPAPMMAIDLRTLSSKLLLDTKYQGTTYDIVTEIEPTWKDGVRQQHPAYSYLAVGAMYNFDTWNSTGSPRPTGIAAFTRHTGNATTFPKNIEFGSLKYNTGGTGTQIYTQTSGFPTAPSPFNSWDTNTTRKMSATLDPLYPTVMHNNGTCSVRRADGGVSSTFTTPNNVFDANLATNNIWLVIYSSRSTSSIQAGDIPYKVKTISIYERSLS